MAHPAPDSGEVAAVRAFNRFHTRLVGALNGRMLDSPYALPQLRVLYEIAIAPEDAPPTAAKLADALGVDAGYLSRLIARLAADGLVARAPFPGHGRRLALRLTDAGRAAFATIDASSAAEVAALLAPLSPAERRALTGAMQRVRRLLGDPAAERRIVVREPRPGDLGWVVHRHGALYAAEHRFDRSFEGLVADIVGRFVRTFDPSGERAWIAELDGEIVGSVLVVREDAETARLRLLYVEPLARGLGLGRRLVELALAFARGSGYRRMELWTNDILGAARRIYEEAGFTLVAEDPHRSFGRDLVGQTWARELRG